MGFRINGKQIGKQQLFQTMNLTKDQIQRNSLVGKLSISSQQDSSTHQFINQIARESGRVDFSHTVKGIEVPSDFRSNPMKYIDSHSEAVKQLVKGEHQFMDPNGRSHDMEKIAENYGSLVKKIKSGNETQEVKATQLEKLEGIYKQAVKEKAQELAGEIADQLNQGNHVTDYEHERYGMIRYQKIMSSDMERQLAGNIEQMLLKGGQFVKEKPNASQAEIAYLYDQTNSETKNLGNLSFRDMKGVLKVAVPNNRLFKMPNETYRQSDFDKLSKVAQEGIALSYAQAAKNQGILDKYHKIKEDMIDEAAKLGGQVEAFRAQVESSQEKMNVFKEEYGNVMNPNNPHHSLYKSMLKLHFDLDEQYQVAKGKLQKHNEMFTAFENDPKPFLGTDQNQNEAESELEEEVKKALGH